MTQQTAQTDGNNLNLCWKNGSGSKEGLGGKVVTEYLNNISIQLGSPNNFDLPINLTSAGLNATADLVNLINQLEVQIQTGKFKDPKQLKSLSLLLDFIISNTQPDFRFNFKLTPDQITLLTQYPIEYQL